MKDSNRKYSDDDIIKDARVSMRHPRGFYGKVFQQIFGIPTGQKCTPFPC